jgi:hypothetical protein
MLPSDANASHVPKGMHFSARRWKNGSFDVTYGPFR